LQLELVNLQLNIFNACVLGNSDFDSHTLWTISTLKNGTKIKVLWIGLLFSFFCIENSPMNIPKVWIGNTLLGKMKFWLKLTILKTRILKRSPRENY